MVKIRWCSVWISVLEASASLLAVGCADVRDVDGAGGTGGAGGTAGSMNACLVVTDRSWCT